MTPASVRNLIVQLQAVKDQPIIDEALRKQLYNATREVALALESPRESVERIFYAVRASRHNVYRPILEATSLTSYCDVSASAVDNGESGQRYGYIRASGRKGRIVGEHHGVCRCGGSGSSPDS